MAAYLGRFEIVEQNTSGDAQASVSVEVRKRGALVNGAQTTVTTVAVYDPGAIVAGDTVQINGIGTVYTVSSVTATTVVLTSAATVVVGDVLSPNSNLPSLFADSSGGLAKTNPLTTNSSGQTGLAFAYVVAGNYDDVATNGATVTFQRDLTVSGPNYLASSFVSPYNIVDTLRTVASTDKILSVRNATTEKFYVRGDGKLSGVNFVGAVVVDSGGLTVTSGGLTVTAGGLTVVASGGDITGDLTLRNNLLIGSTADTNLYRSAANILKTDDSFVVGVDLSLVGRFKHAPTATIDVTTSTLTLPATGNIFFLTSTGGTQTVTAVAGGSGSGMPVYLFATSGMNKLTFTETGNIITHVGGNLGMTYSGSNDQRGLIMFTNGTNWYVVTGQSIP